MVIKKKKVDLEKIQNGVKKFSSVTLTVLRIFWVIIGVSALAAFIFAVYRIGQALSLDLSKIFG